MEETEGEEEVVVMESSSAGVEEEEDDEEEEEDEEALTLEAEKVLEWIGDVSSSNEGTFTVTTFVVGLKSSANSIHIA